MTVSGVKTFLKSYKDWVEVVSGSGKIYYYNKRSLVNQWKKPAEWLEEEEFLSSLIIQLQLVTMISLPNPPSSKQISPQSIIKVK